MMIQPVQRWLHLPFVIAGLACALAAHSAAAAVTVVGTASAHNTAAPGTSLTISGFALGAGNALVVAISTEHNNGATAPAFSVTYGGSAVTSNVAANQGGQGAAIFWAINPGTTSGDVVVTFGPTTAVGSVSVMSLGNVAGVADSNSGTSTAAADITLNYTGTAGGLVVAAHVDNSFSTGTIPTISGGNVDTTLQAIPNNQNGISSGMIQAYGDIAAAGAYSETFTESRLDNSTRNAAALVAFVAIVPEPASLALLGLGGLTLLRRRTV